MKKYNDIIQLQDYFHPVFDLQNETKGYWKQFVPTLQFYALLEKTLDAVSSATPAKRKSIWVQGTFGTGKSHAGSVIRHLLCDGLAGAGQYIGDHIEKERPDLAARLRKLLTGMPFFPVVLKGVDGAHNLRSFALTVQRRVRESLRDAGILLRVNSDFEMAIEIINTNALVKLDEILPHAPELRALAKNKAKIIEKLKASDTDVFLALEEALAKYNISLSSDKKLTVWLSEIESELRKQGKADGLFLFWDEFTSVMDTISSGLVNMIQSIAELSEKQNVWLYLISHRHGSAYGGGERGEDVKKMNDRFHIVPYKMEANTTYRLMSATMRRKDEARYNEIFGGIMPSLAELIKYLSDDGSATSQKDIKNLFPLHPYTAFLCSMISGQIGSSNRSVFRFLYDDEKGFQEFIRTADADGSMLTADRLWDFFTDEFSDDKYSAINGTCNTHIETVRAKSSDTEKVFKGVLLLNALRNVLNNERVIPSQKNLLRLFEFELEETIIRDALDFLNQRQIIQKDPSDNFIISLSALPPIEVDKERGQQRSQFPDAVSVLKSSESAVGELNVQFKSGLSRECELVFLSASDDVVRLESRLRQGFQKNWTLRIALFFARNNKEKQDVAPMLARLAQQHKSVIFISFDEVLDCDDLQYERFISYFATAIVAGRHADNEQQRANRDNAQRIVTNWTSRIKDGNYRLHFQGDEHTGATVGLTKYINEQIARKIFGSSADALDSLRNKPATFWKPSAAKKVAEFVITSPTRDQLVSKLTGQYKPAELLLKDDEGDDFIVDNVLVLKTSAPDEHPLVRVHREVERLLRQAQKNHAASFNLGQVLQPLSAEPFGLYANTPNFFLLTYALRPYLAELYDDDLGTPLTPDTLRDKVDAIFKFWSGGSENQLRVRFGSHEEKKLIKFLHSAFGFNETTEASMKTIRWNIMEYCKKKALKPIWCLKYHDGANDAMKTMLTLLSNFILAADVKQDDIGKLWQAAEPLSFEFTELIKTQTAFADGFRGFVKTLKDSDVVIKEEWLGELDAYLASEMNMETGNWTEGNVREKIQRFYIRKLARPVEIPPPPPPPLPLMEINAPVSAETSVVEIVTEARKKIESADSSQLRATLSKVLEAYPNTAAIIYANL